jgi:hypothetical protein
MDRDGPVGRNKRSALRHPTGLTAQCAALIAPYELVTACFFFARARRIAWLNSPP